MHMTVKKRLIDINWRFLLAITLIRLLYFSMMKIDLKNGKKV